MSRTISTQQATQPPDDSLIRPFQVNFPEAELTELRKRINATKWPERETVTDASQGVQLATMQVLARYWATEYDWRKIEAKLNALPQFITEIDGLDIYFIHVRSKHTSDHCADSQATLSPLRNKLVGLCGVDSLRTFLLRGNGLLRSSTFSCAGSGSATQPSMLRHHRPIVPSSNRRHRP